MIPESPVTRLCAEGIQLEGADPAAAKSCYERAWSIATTDLERSIAAHYLARNQPAEEAFRWNRTALDLARSIRPEESRDLLPSLLLNMGKSHEDRGEFASARSAYEEGQARLAELPDSPYLSMVQMGIVNGLRRVDPDSPGDLR